MNDSTRLEVTARFDSDVVAADQPARKPLLLELTARTPEKEMLARRPLALALVIDRSGSMRGSRLQAARQAARGIAGEMREQDRLSVVSFHHDVCTHISSQAMDRSGCRRALAAIDDIRPAGTTDLGAGWFAGARCAAQSQDRHGFEDAHVLVLSDGMANRGMTNPDELATHAAELAGRGIYSSAAGIGAAYSPLQLDAIAEAGGGSLHDADSPQDIIEVVMGELGELRQLAAKNVRIDVTVPDDVAIEWLTKNRRQVRSDGRMLEIGNLRADRTRSLAMMVDIPALALGEQRALTIASRWRDPSSGEHCSLDPVEARVTAVQPEQAACAQRDMDLVRRLSDLWEASLAYRATRRNEAGDYSGAQMMFATSESEYGRIVADLEDAPARLARYARARKRVGSRWEGRAKREAITAAKKRMRNEPDHRSGGGRAGPDLFSD